MIRGGLTQWLLLLALLATLTSARAAPGAHGPNGEHLASSDGPVAANSLGRLADGSVTVPKAAQRRLAIRTQLATPGRYHATLELPGRVLVDPNHSGQVTALVGGRVEAGPTGLPLPGQQVRRGELLAYLQYHADPYTQAAQQALLSELAGERQLAEQRAARLAGLEGAVAAKEIQAAAQQARTLAEREQQIRASLTSKEALHAPIDGVIASLTLAVGEVIAPGQAVASIIAPGQLLIEATTTQVDLPARVHQATLRDQPQVALSLVGAARVIKDGVVPLLFKAVATEAGQPLPLAVGAPVTLIVQHDQPLAGFRLPASAVVRSPANQTVVWIKAGAQRFIPQPVTVRPLDSSHVVVTAGLGADNRVVIEGAALIAQIR